MRRRRILRGLGRGLLVLIALWLWQVMVLLTEIDAYGRVDRAVPADVIIVLGAGLRADNTPGPALTRRALHAANLWTRGLAPMILCSGGHPGIQTRTEADACAELLRGDGIPETAILQENQSRSTEENALYSRQIMDTHGWQTAILVSDNFHLFRANHIFGVAGITAYTSPVTENPPGLTEYVVYMLREVAALHWQIVKEVFNLPITYVQSI